MIKKRFFKELFSTAILVFIISLVINYIRSPETYDILPNLKLTSIDGKKIDLNRSKPTIIHFFATWCPICKAEASNFNNFKDGDANLIAIAVKSPDIREFIKRNSLTYTVVDDLYGELADGFNIDAFPTTLIYDTNGELRFSEVGYSTFIGLKARLIYFNIYFRYFMVLFWYWRIILFTFYSLILFKNLLFFLEVLWVRFQLPIWFLNLTWLGRIRPYWLISFLILIIRHFLGRIGN